MTAVPLLSDDEVGRVTKVITDFLYLDTKNAQFIHEELSNLSMKEFNRGYNKAFQDEDERYHV